MAIRYLWSGATGANNGTSWADAYTDMVTALAACSASDTLYVAHDHFQNFNISTRTLAFPATPGFMMLCVDRTSGALATTGMVQNGTVSGGILTIQTSGCAYIYGLIIRANDQGTTISLGPTTNQGSLVLENCTLWVLDGVIRSGGTTTTVGVHVQLINCTFKRTNTVLTGLLNFQYANVGIFGGTLDLPSSSANVLFATGKGSIVRVDAFDFSPYSITNLVSSVSVGDSELRFVRCKLPAGVTPYSTALTSPPGAEVYLIDCSNGDNHGLFGYYNTLGSLVSDTGIYYTGGAASQSWKITTTSVASRVTPFITPWIDWFNSDTSTSITPRFEVLRDGSTTAYTEAQVWAEFLAKTNSGSPLASRYLDRQSYFDEAAGTTAPSQAAGAGLVSWTGEGGSAWSGKCDSGAAFTPAEVGHISGRICFAAPSATLYVDPQIRT